MLHRWHVGRTIPLFSVELCEGWVTNFFYGAMVVLKFQVRSATIGGENNIIKAILESGGLMKVATFIFALLFPIFAAASADDDKIVKLTEDLADYTFWLAVFTAALFATSLFQFIVIFWQGRQLKRSVDSAEAESMPFLFPLILPGHESQKLFGVNGDVSHIPEVTFLVENHGKTPAILHELKHELVLVEQLPVQPD